MVLMMLLLFGCSSSQISYTHLSMDEAVDQMQESENYVIVDVRTLDEYNEGHIPGAICIPNESIEDCPKELPDLDQDIFVYCRSGKRSQQAAKKLVDLGYTHVYEMGGILDWNGDIEK